MPKPDLKLDTFGTIDDDGLMALAELLVTLAEAEQEPNESPNIEQAHERLKHLEKEIVRPSLAATFFMSPHIKRMLWSPVRISGLRCLNSSSLMHTPFLHHHLEPPPP